MTRRTDLPAPLASAPFAIRDALRLDVAPHRTFARDLRRPFHGTRLPAEAPDDLEQLCRALATRFRDGDAFTGPTAARLHGIPVPGRFAHDLPLHVSSVIPTRPFRRRGVRGSVRSSGEPIELAGLPVLDPVDTLIALGAVLELPDLIAAMDFAVTGTWDEDPLLSLERLRVALEEERPRQPGLAWARFALSHVRVGPLSRPESLIRLLLVWAGLPEPVLNAPIIAPGVRLHPDLGWPDYRLGLEYNGDPHENAFQYARDLSRLNAYAECGYAFVNVEKTELFGSPLAVVHRVARRLAERGWTPPAPVRLPRNWRVAA